MILQSSPDDAHGWVVVSASSCLLAVPASAAAGLGGLAERLAGPGGFRAALELLLAAGIADAPPFALVDGDSSVARVVLRGDATVAVTSADPDAADHTISGAGMATWSEHVVEGARSLRLQVPGSTWTLHLESPASRIAAGTTAAEGTEPPASVGQTTLVPRTEIGAPPVATIPPLGGDPGLEHEPGPEPEETARDSGREPEPYDFLFGDTIYRTQAGVSVRIPNPDPERPGDHDGRTMLAEELGLPGRVPPASVPSQPSPAESRAAESPAAEPPASEVTVLAPVAGRSAASASSIAPPSPASAPPSPTLRLEGADGRREPLDRPVLIGRAPAAAGPEPAPRLITIADDRDISRSHVRVAVEGDAVVVTDLASKNGTIVTLPGGTPRKLRGGEPTVVLPGTLIDLGGGVVFTVRED